MIRTEAIRSGANIVVDSVLPDAAAELGRQFESVG